MFQLAIVDPSGVVTTWSKGKGFCDVAVSHIPKILKKLKIPYTEIKQEKIKGLF